MINQLITEFPISDFPKERSISKEKINKYAYTIEEVDALIDAAVEKAVAEARTSLLAELDVQFQRALETGTSTTDIVAKKQALRDAPSNSSITSANSEAELKAQWDTCILGSSPY